MLLIVALAGPAHARVDGYPHLDNETIGLFNALYDAVDGPVDEFDEVHWGLTLLQSIDGGDAMNPLRYFIAFSGYAVAQTSVYTPAWREPYRVALQGYIEKMLLPVAWRDWLEVWGGVNPLGPDNIMYSGHLIYMMTMYRQLFGDTQYEDGFDLTTADGATTFESDAKQLTDWIAAQAEAYVDNAGEPTFGIACEPGRIFLPCNGPHRASQIVHDGLYGTDYQSTDGAWLEWIQQKMVNQEHGVLHDLYWPFGKREPDPSAGEAPLRYETTSGLYNGWSLWFLHAFDETWATQLYGAWRAYFVVSGDDSPYPDGRTMVVDKGGLEGVAGLAFDMGATGFGMILARLFDEPVLYDDLLYAWSKLFGEPAWAAENRRFTWGNPVFPALIQNGFPLLARTTSPERNIGTNARLSRDVAFFQQPYIASISEPNAFVNQAVWDAEQQRLIVTLNGGGATTASAVIEVANLDPAKTWEAVRADLVWADATWTDDRLVLTTAPLSNVEETYVVRQVIAAPDPIIEAEPPARPAPPVVDPGPGASGCRAAAQPARHDPMAFFALLLILLAQTLYSRPDAGFGVVCSAGGRLYARIRRGARRAGGG